MALLDWISEANGPVVRGEGVMLRPPRAADHEAWAALRLESRAYLQPWEPTWPEDDLTRAAFKRRLAIYSREMEAGNAWPFFIFRETDHALLGAITLSNVRRGVAETGVLGYWIGRRFAGQGHATGAVRVSATQQDDACVIRVADDGPGIPPRLSDRLFEAFVSGRATGGTGLGLTISRELAELNGGTLSLVETGLTGTVFELRLPN